MRIKSSNDSAFSLLEILLASIIFVLTVSGIFVTLDAIRRPVADKESALSAAVFGKQVLEALRARVSAVSSANYYTVCSGNCTDFSLALGTHQVSVATLGTYGLNWPSTALSNANLVGGNPTLSYTVSCSDGSANSNCGADTARKVDLNIVWNPAS